MWDDTRTLDVIETCDDILARSLAAAYAALEERLGKRPDRWEWGKLHTLTYTNATLGKSGIGFVEGLFNRGPTPLSGGLNVLFRNDFKVPTAFDVTHVASMRMIADLSVWSSTLWLNSPGQERSSRLQALQRRHRRIRERRVFHPSVDARGDPEAIESKAHTRSGRVESRRTIVGWGQ